MSLAFPYRTRRTIKPPMMDPVRNIPEKILMEILEDAHWAPTHGMTQPWHFHVFTDDGRALLVKALQSLYDEITPAAEFRAEKRAKLSDNILQAPITIAVTAHVESCGTISKQDELCATACAVQNLLLSAYQRGIGSFWATPPVACSQEVTQWLGLDSQHISLGLIFLGYVREGHTAKSLRSPLQEKITFYRLADL